MNEIINDGIIKRYPAVWKKVLIVDTYTHISHTILSHAYMCASALQCIKHIQ